MVDIYKYWTTIQTGVSHLLTLAATEAQSIQTIEQDNPIVRQAILLAKDEAESLGVPVAQIEAIGPVILAGAKAFATVIANAGAAAAGQPVPTQETAPATAPAPAAAGS